MEEVKIQGGKVLDACREVQIQVRINIYQDGDHDVNADFNLTSEDIFDYDDAVLVMLCRPLGQKRSNNYTWRRSSSLFG